MLPQPDMQSAETTTETKRFSTLISRNITVCGHRTSMRLEPAMWDALSEICRREKLSIHQLASMVFERKADETSFTAAVRVFSMSYFRAAATEDGHRQAGHGSAFLFSAQKDFSGLMPRGSTNAHNSNVSTGSSGHTGGHTAGHAVETMRRY